MKKHSYFDDKLLQRRWILPTSEISNKTCQLCGYPLGTKNVCYRYIGQKEYCHVGCWYEGSDFQPTTKPPKDNPPLSGEKKE